MPEKPFKMASTNVETIMKQLRRAMDKIIYLTPQNCIEKRVSSN
jgi:hypothetical protein